MQRLTCIFTFIFTWMAVNAMWFEVAPEGQVDVYIGFQGFSYQEIIIGFISALIVFPLNLLFLLLFRKSREKEVGHYYYSSLGARFHCGKFSI